jgi:alpha-ketoglutarate-dependent 2,4-dichlorophenoxyacetate dioxygenase
MGALFVPLHPVFAAEARGLDIRRPLARDAVREIHDGMNRFAVLVFRGQSLTQDEQIAFTRQFGELDIGFRRVTTAGGPLPPHRFSYQELADISNVGLDGSVAARESRKIVANIANQLWHADSSFQHPRARYSMLHAVVVPAKGGETEFCDERNAYDRLDEDAKARLEGLVAEHFALHSRFLLGDTDYSEAQVKAIQPVRWPIVQTHAGSGRKHLYIGAHARAIDGMTVAEARMLLMDLLEHATQREFLYRHRWQPSDLVIWDNRCVLHRGRAYDLSERRELRRSTTVDVETEREPQAA